MKNQQKINIILRASLSLLFDIFIISILDKLKLRIDILNIRLLLKFFFTGVSIWTVCTIAKFLYKRNLVDVYFQINDTLKSIFFILQEKLLPKKDFLTRETAVKLEKTDVNLFQLPNFKKIISSVNLLMLLIGGIIIYSFFDIFSKNQISDMTILFISIFFIVFNLIAGVEGKIFIVIGIVFLIMCPFFVFKNNEFFADKSASWAFMFFIVGVSSEVLQQDNKNLVGLKNIFNYQLDRKLETKNVPDNKKS